MRTKRFFIYAYNNVSKSARLLADELDALIIKHEHSRYKKRPHHVLINWGSSSCPYSIDFNNFQSVGVASNKLVCFQTLGLNVRTVPWTTSINKAKEDLDEGATVVARTILTGHSGDGIIIVNPGDPVPDAPLYTKYIKKESEWRVHCYKDNNGVVKEFYVQRKIKDPNIAEPKTWLVRNHDNGFIFQHENITPPEDVITQGELALAATGLDFGAVDVIYNKHEQKAYVLEVNSAPGLEGESVKKYADMFRSLL